MPTEINSDPNNLITSPVEQEYLGESFKPKLGIYRKWALRFFIYVIVSELAIAILHFRFVFGAFDPADTRERMTILYGCTWLFFILAIVMTVLGDRRDEEKIFHRAIILYASIIGLIAKLLMAIFQEGVYWFYWVNFYID